MLVSVYVSVWHPIDAKYLHISISIYVFSTPISVSNQYLTQLLWLKVMLRLRKIFLVSIGEIRGIEASNINNSQLNAEKCPRFCAVDGMYVDSEIL